MEESGEHIILGKNEPLIHTHTTYTNKHTDKHTVLYLSISFSLHILCLSLSLSFYLSPSHKHSLTLSFTFTFARLHSLTGTGELYLNCVLNDLRNMYADMEVGKEGEEKEREGGEREESEGEGKDCE